MADEAWRRLVGHHLSARSAGDEEEINVALERLERDDGRVRPSASGC
jgi:hypothetical protein